MSDLQVIEFMGRSPQGRTQPYICRCDDGLVYFVKGRSATRHGLINEWVCAELALALDLPLAPYAIAQVPQESMDADVDGSLRDLGAGAVFASQRISAQDLTAAQVPLVPLAQRRDVLAFDWWVRNGDRMLTEQGGNVNLLWSEQPRSHERSGLESGLVVIDHNLAFDPTFSDQDFFELHVFADDAREAFSDFVWRDHMLQRFAHALAHLKRVWDNLPSDWHHVDPEQTIPTESIRDSRMTTLERIHAPDFWSIT